MILADTSIWIDLLSARPKQVPSEEDLLRLVTCGPVLQEVFQGMRPGLVSEAFTRSFLALPCLSDPLPRDLFEDAARIYREGRQKGFTIRSSADCLIAAIAIAHRVPVWHKDRDFATIAKFTSLRETMQLESGRASGH